MPQSLPAPAPSPAENDIDLTCIRRRCAQRRAGSRANSQDAISDVGEAACCSGRSELRHLSGPGSVSAARKRAPATEHDASAPVRACPRCP